MATPSEEENTVRPQNSIDSDECESELHTDQFMDPDFDIDSFIDDEFSTISDAIFEDVEPDSVSPKFPPRSPSVAASQLAQQLENLKESFQDAGCSGEVPRRPRVTFQTTESEGSLSSTVQNGEGLHICARCRALRADSAPTVESKMEIVEENGQNSHSAPDARNTVVSDDQIVDITEEVGTCWKSLGPILGIKNATLTNIDADCPNSREKANRLLSTWKEHEGAGATVCCLEQALLRIKRRDIADILSSIAGLPSIAVQEIQHINKPLNMNIKVSLTTDSIQPDNIVLLCEDSSGRKYLVKEITDGNEWNVDKIVDDERVLERMITAARYSKKTKEQRRQESLKRVSAELSLLRKKIQRVKLSSEDGENEVSPRDEQPHSKPSCMKEIQMLHAELEEVLRSCEVQCQGWQAMFRVLIKLIGEVGPLDGNSRCLKQLSDFTNELRDQENKVSPKIDQLYRMKEDLEKEQLARLESLKQWQKIQNQQVDGIEKLLTSLLEQGNIKIRKQKLQNRKSEPILSRMLAPNKAGRRRVKTDSSESKGSYLSSLNDAREISSPLCARHMQVMER